MKNHARTFAISLLVCIAPAAAAQGITVGDYMTYKQVNPALRGYAIGAAELAMEVSAAMQANPALRPAAAFCAPAGFDARVAEGALDGWFRQKRAPNQSIN